MGKKKIALISTVLVVALVAAFIVASLGGSHVLNLYGSSSMNLNTNAGGSGSQSQTPTLKADASVYITRNENGKYELLGYMTQLGLNVSFAKFTGLSSGYNMTQYNYNITSISIGDGSPTQALTVLPGEWNRTSVTMHDAAYNTCNFTAVFHPDTNGPYSANCIGLNIGPVTVGAAYSLICYDTFTQVTGIDNTFTITVEYRLYSTSA